MRSATVIAIADDKIVNNSMNVYKGSLETCTPPFDKQGQDSAQRTRRGGIPVQQVNQKYIAKRKKLPKENAVRGPTGS